MATARISPMTREATCVRCCCRWPPAFPVRLTVLGLHVALAAYGTVIAKRRERLADLLEARPEAALDDLVDHGVVCRRGTLPPWGRQAERRMIELHLTEVGDARPPDERQEAPGGWRSLRSPHSVLPGDAAHGELRDLVRNQPDGVRAAPMRGDEVCVICHGRSTPFMPRWKKALPGGETPWKTPPDPCHALTATP